MSNILIDFYSTNPTRDGFEKFFTTHAAWVLEDIQRYHERTGEDWWESKNAADFWLNHERVRRIVDDYFSENILKTSLFAWLQNIEKRLNPHLTIEPVFVFREDENIDLTKHQLVRVFYDSIHQIALEPVYQELYEELLKMLRVEKAGVKKCPSCEKLFVPKQAGGYPQKNCSHACRQRAYRDRKEQS